MNIYGETNFILELTFVQEESESCEKFLSICNKKKGRLIVPALSFVEPTYKLYRQEKVRQNIQRDLGPEIQHFLRNPNYRKRLKNIKDLETLLAQSIHEEKARFDKYRKDILEVAEVISLEESIIGKAADFEKQYDLSLQDAVIYASVLSHLLKNKPDRSCFLTRDRKGFDTPDIRNNLKKLNCRVISSFEDGLGFIESRK